MANIEWDKLGFNYIRTRSHIEYTYKDGSWSEAKLSNDDTFNLSIAANALHYGQAVFEGLKAFKCEDGKVRVFRDSENAARINRSSEYVCMPSVPYETFKEAIDTVIKDNIDYVPPYGTGGALYIRPFVFGSGPIMGVAPASEYKFMVYVSPVGPYYKEGIKPVDAVVLDEYDRAAPNGAGSYKLAGNYAAGMYSSIVGKKKGFQVVLFLDPKEHKYVDEFTTSNFMAISKDGKYITPKSKSVLASITNKSLMQLAKDIGIEVEMRPIEFAELETCKEVGACGTAVVITPIGSITRNDSVMKFGDECGPTLLRLYNMLKDIQYGKAEDAHGWTRVVE